MNWTLLLLVSTAITGAPTVLKALRSVKAKAFSIELLISISIAGALFIGEYVESAALSFLFAVGAYFEKAALRRIRTAVQRLQGTPTHTPDPDTHARMMERLEDAQESQASGQQFLQRFARIYTPLVVGCSVLAYFLTNNIAQALTFLVIACPGALVISVPASLAAGLANAARHGVFVRDAPALEKLASVDKFIVQSPDATPGIGLLQSQGHRVALVSRSDTPTEQRATADVDIIMGTRPGPYLDEADIVVWSDKPADVQRAISLARATVANMKQNTYFALGISALMMASAFFGFIQMASGIFLHEASILLVILNALRLLRNGR